MQSQIDRLEQTIQILKTPSAQRAEVQVSFLQQETSHIELFKTYKEEDGDDELQRLCCMYMKYEYFQKDQTVFKIDDIGTKFYIIISGKVGVYIRMPKHKRQELILENNGEINPIEENPLQMVKELRIGDSFGELALLKNSKRLASIICKEDCHFGVIDKKIFNLALKEKEEEKLNVQMRFLANSPLFSRLPKNTIKILHMNAFYVEYKKSQPVFLEGQNTSACYVIKSGEFTGIIKYSILISNHFIVEYRQNRLLADFDVGFLYPVYNLYKNIRNIYKTIEHVIKPFEKKNQYLTGGEGQKTIDLKISVLGRGELFGEIEIVSGELRQTSAYCTSLEGGELMIINRTDLEGRVLCEDDQLKKEQLNKRIEGMKNQLSKYKNYRFMATASKIHEVDVVEQIKNKELDYSINDLDEVFQSQNDYNDDDQIGLLTHQIKPQSRQNTRPNIQLSKSMNSSIIPSNNKNKNTDIYQQLNNNAKSIDYNTFDEIQAKLDLLDDKSQQNITSHITKNTKEQFMNKWFGNNETEYQPKKENIMRIELGSYTDLKNNIRKKTAVALSKQYRQPYKNFMYAGQMYDISQSEQSLHNQQQNQQILKNQTSKDGKDNKDGASQNKMSGLTLSNLQIVTNKLTKSNSQQHIRSLTSIDLKSSQMSNRPGQQKDNKFNQTLKDQHTLKDIEEIKDGEESVKNTIILQKNFNIQRRVKSHGSMRQHYKKNNLIESFNESDNYQIVLNSKTKFSKDENDSINQNSQNYQEGAEELEDINLRQQIETHYNNSTNEEGGKMYQKRLKNILKLDINIKKDNQEFSPNFTPISSYLNSPLILSKRGSLMSNINRSQSNFFKNIFNNEQTKNSPIVIPLKNAEIFFEKQNKKSPKKTHLRLHDKESPIKLHFSQTLRSSSSLLSSKKNLDDGVINPYFTQSITGLFNNIPETSAKNPFIEQITSVRSIMTQPLSPLSPCPQSFLSSNKISLFNNNIKSSKKQQSVDYESKDREPSPLERYEESNKGDSTLTKSQNIQRSLILKSNNYSIPDQNQIISIKSIGSVQDLRVQSSERQHRISTGNTSPQKLLYKDISNNGVGLKLPSYMFSSIKNKQKSDQAPLYKFQQESPFTIRRQKEQPAKPHSKIIHQLFQQSNHL